VLRIHPQTSAADVKKYFEVADYYSEGQETVGQWGGKLAGRLGLTGKVTGDAFGLLCNNINPLTGKPLTPRTNDDRRVGYDFVFSGPKSFSVLLGLAPEEERRLLDKDFEDSVSDTMLDIEADMQCRVRAKGADYDRTTGNMVWAGFGHTTARPVAGQPPDPQRHTHVFVFNGTEDEEEKRIKAGQFVNLKRDGEYYTALFYAKLARKLQDRGYVIDRRGGKVWEIAGIPQSVIDKFNKRSEEIEAEHQRRLRDDPDYRPEYKHELGAKTRSRKDKVLTPTQLRAEWYAQLTDDERDALAAVYGREIAAGTEVTAAQAVAYAIHHCFERESVVSERELVRVALLYGLGSLAADEIRAEFPRQDVLLAEQDGRLLATTRVVHWQERVITAFARGGLGTVWEVGVPAGLSRVLPDGHALDDDQWNVVTGLLSSCDKVQIVDAAAGVGKSTMLGVYDQGMKLAGKNVTYLATTTPAVGVLRQDGFDAETVAKFLMSEKMQNAAKGGYVVVDEASMLGLRDTFRLFGIAKENNMKLVLMGDSRQHSSVSAGAVMRLLQEYGAVRAHRIANIKRQKNKHHKEAVALMFSGKTLQGFDILDKKLGWVKEIADSEQRYAAMAREYVDALKSGTMWNQLLLISPTHAEGRQVTAAVRALMRQEGMLGREDHEFTQWVNANLTEAEKGDARNYRPGTVDMVQFFQNAPGHKAGSRVELGAAGVSSLPIAQGEKFQAYRKETVKFAEGDILRFTAGGMTLDGHQIRNGSAYKIAGFTPAAIKLDNGWLVANDFGHFKHGIETSPGSQSKTVTHAIVGQSSQSFGASSQEQEYVTASRARVRVTIYTDNKADLRAAIQRSSLKKAAHDLIKPASPSPSGWEQWRAQRRRRQAALARTREGEGIFRPGPDSPRTPPSHTDRVRQYESELTRGR
jgi:conjugative relaxase-like TrwC/TraI family protein